MNVFVLSFQFPHFLSLFFSLLYFKRTIRIAFCKPMQLVIKWLKDGI